MRDRVSGMSKFEDLESSGSHFAKCEPEQNVIAHQIQMYITR
jgi:hypothetical protein